MRKSAQRCQKIVTSVLTAEAPMRAQLAAHASVTTAKTARVLGALAGLNLRIVPFVPRSNDALNGIAFAT